MSLHIWSTIDWGRYPDKTLPQVLFRDPDWFFHMEHAGFFGNLAKQAAKLSRKARNIRVPQAGPVDLIVEHFIHPRTGKYSHFVLVPADKDGHQGHSTTLRSEVIDMSVPRQFGSYDKLGNKNLVQCLGNVYGLGRLTKRRCEEFFENDAHFRIE